jgi:hypothetical protein
MRATRTLVNELLELAHDALNELTDSFWDGDDLGGLDAVLDALASVLDSIADSQDRPAGRRSDYYLAHVATRFSNEIEDIDVLVKSIEQLYEGADAFDYNVCLLNDDEVANAEESRQHLHEEVQQLLDKLVPDDD